MPKEVDSQSGDNLRPKRSRKDRPCDHCRRAKRSCHITVRGEACTHCRKAHRECSFNGPPLNRHRKASHSPSRDDHDPDDQEGHSASVDPVRGPSTVVSPHVVSPHVVSPHSLVNGVGAGAKDYRRGSAQPPPGPLSAGPSQHPLPSPASMVSIAAHSAASSGLSPSFPPPLPSTSGPSHPPLPSFPPVSWMAERSTLHAPSRAPPPAPVQSSLASFLESLEDDQHGSPRVNTDDDSHYNSLEMDVTEGEESHYLGSGAVAQLASVSLDSRIESRNASSLPYRQVADPRYPAYFLKNPSKVYGVSNAAYVAEKAYEDVHKLISAVDSGLPGRLIDHFVKRTLPALPILNSTRFEASLHGYQGAGRFPCAVLVGIFAHAAIYEPSLRRHCKHLWTVLLQVLDNEYRQPRLQTLQLEILDITGRPIINPGGNHLGICRAVGAIQLLGLHRDCSRWKLPKWERSLRKRLWWALYIDDKWNSYTYGRPVNIEGARSNIPALTLDDDDFDKHCPSDKVADIACFIALCRLSTVLENLLPLLLDRDTDSRKYSQERRVIANAVTELDGVYRDLPADLRFNPANTEYPARPGSRSLQLAHIGITLLICRLGLERDDFLSLPHMINATKRALGVIETLAIFLDCLRTDDYHSFWTAWSAYQLSNAVTLLLQQAIRIHQHPAADHHGERRQCTSSIFSMLRRVVMAIQFADEGGWEVAEAATPRIKSLIKAMPPIPGIEHVQSIVAAPAAPANAPPPLDWAPSKEVEPDQAILALFDWLNGSNDLLGGERVF